MCAFGFAVGIFISAYSDVTTSKRATKFSHDVREQHHPAALPPPKLYSVVISACLGKSKYTEGELSHMKSYFNGYRLPESNITIVSKCGVVWDEGAFPSSVSVDYLPNVGRNDHTYLHWIVKHYNHLQNLDNSNVLMFIKDHMEQSMRMGGAGPPTPLEDMLWMATSRGFACLIKSKPGRSYLHLTSKLQTFSLDNYNNNYGGSDSAEFKSRTGSNLGEFARLMNITLPKILTPVCYRGHFATIPSQIIQYPLQFWVQLRDALSRTDNMEEGHFLERLWFLILAKPHFESDEQANAYFNDFLMDTCTKSPGCLYMKEQSEGYSYILDTLANGQT